MTETLRRLEGLVASLVSWRTTTDARLDRMVANLNGTQCEMEVRLGQLEREPSRDLMGRPQ